MSTRDIGPTELTEVVVRSQDNLAVRVRFCDRFRPDEDCVHYAIEACAPGLNARVDEVVAWIWDANLEPFLEELARDYRGWDGERVWQNNEFGHPDVHENHVGAGAAHCVHGLGPVGCFGDDVDPVCHEDHAEAGADQRLVVGDHDAQRGFGHDVVSKGMRASTR